MRFQHGLAFFLAALAGTAHADFTVTTPPQVTLTPQKRVDNAIDAFKATRKFKGAVVVVIDHGVMRRFYYGTRDSMGNTFNSSTPIAIASNTKTFVGTTLAIFDKYSSSIKRTTKIGTLVWSVNQSSPPYNATLGDLADYWSGLPRDMPTAPTTRSGLYQSLNQCASWNPACVAPEGTPGYSNYGFYVLGNILAGQQGYAKWSDFNKHYVTEPLGMDETCTRSDSCHPNFSATHAEPFDDNGNEVSLPPINDITAPGGALWSTANDMGMWMLYNLGNIAATSDVRTQQLDAVLPAVQSPLHGAAGFGWKFSSLAFSDGTSSTVRWKLGRYTGFDSYIGLSDDRDTGVFVFLNRDPVDPMVSSPDDVLRDELATKILAQFP